MATKNFAANLRIGAVMGSSVGRVFGGLKAKIKEQEATLKGLRKAYKDAERGTGEYAGKLDQLKTKIAATERSLLRMRAAAKFDIGASLKGVGSALGRDLGRAGIVGGVVAGAGIGIAKNMLDVTAQFEKALTVLKTIEGDSVKAQKSFAWIQDFAQKTPFELQQVLDSFVKLKAYGIDPIRGDSLRILGDTASAMGKDVNDAVEAMADAITGENERLKEFGIKGSKAGGKIAYEFVNKAGKQMKKTVNANNRAAIQSTILAIFNEKYKGAMDDQSKTWNGMVSNMKDAWARFAYQVMMSGPFEKLKTQLGGVLEEVGKMAADGRMKEWAEKTGKWMVDTATKIGEVTKSVWDGVNAVKNFVGGWENLGWIIVGLNFAPTILAVGQLAKGLWGIGAAAWGATGPIGLMIGAIAAATLAFGWFITHQEEAYQWLVEKFPNAMHGLETFLFESIEGIKMMFGDLKKFVLDGAEGMRMAFVDATNAITGAFKAMFDWVGAKFDWFVNKAAELGKAMKDLFSWGTEKTSASGGALPVPRGMMIDGSVLDRKTSLVSPEQMPSPNRSVSQSNTVHINVNAPGADGTAIARAARQEINRRPLFDMDGALVPA